MITTQGQFILKHAEDLEVASLFAHTTNLDALKNMLSSGRIKSLRHIAKETPDKVLSVESGWFPIRSTMRAEDAYTAMKTKKDPDKVFFSRGGWMPNYGDCVLVKRLGNSLRAHDKLNFIPEEFTTRRPVSLKHNAEIYVPDEKINELRAEFGAYKLRPKSGLQLPAYGLFDRACAFVGKLGKHFNKEASDEAKYKKLFGRNARLVGSEALGINLPDSSDTDIFVPYKRKTFFERACGRIPEKYPGLKLNAVSLTRDDKKTFQGEVSGKPMDVVIAYGPRAEKFKDAFGQAADLLTDARKKEIVSKKQELKNAWFFPEWRYKRYKKQLANDLGLAKAYF